MIQSLSILRAFKTCRSVACHLGEGEIYASNKDFSNFVKTPLQCRIELQNDAGTDTTNDDSSN